MAADHPPHLAVQTHPWYQQLHHTASGFHNIYRCLPAPPSLKVFSWILRSQLRRKQNVLPPVVHPDAEQLVQRPSWLRITWIGHAVGLVQTATLTLLTDPMFSSRASPLAVAGPKREPALPLSLEALPPVDVVLLSHDHYDHLDARSIRILAARFDPVFLAPLGIGAYIRRWGGRQVAELDWWQYVEVGGTRFHCTPAEHFSGRILAGEDRTLWAGWYVEPIGASSDEAPHVFFAGDTTYTPHFRELRTRFGPPDVALLPIGAYLPRWLMARVHMTPKEAIQAFLDLDAAHMLPVHWGTFDLADEPLQEPARLVLQGAYDMDVQHRVHLVAIGTSLTFRPKAGPTLSSPDARLTKNGFGPGP